MGRIEVDLFALVRAGGEGNSVADASVVQGTRPIGEFSRLIDGLPPQNEVPVEWSVRGESTGAGRRFIDVHAQGEVTLECQRCLKPFVMPLKVENRLEIVKSPSQLEDDDEIERIVGSTRFDVLELIEDELILSLPTIPKHEVCPSMPSEVGSDPTPDTEAERPSPFAALQQLKKDQ